MLPRSIHSDRYAGFMENLDGDERSSTGNSQYRFDVLWFGSPRYWDFAKLTDYADWVHMAGIKFHRVSVLQSVLYIEPKI